MLFSKHTRVCVIVSVVVMLWDMISPRLWRLLAIVFRIPPPWYDTTKLDSLVFTTFVCMRLPHTTYRVCLFVCVFWQKQDGWMQVNTHTSSPLRLTYLLLRESMLYVRTYVILVENIACSRKSNLPRSDSEETVLPDTASCLLGNN